MFLKVSNIANYSQYNVSTNSLEKNNIENKDIQLGKLIGEGRGAKVYLDANNENFVLKEIYTEYKDPLLREVDALNKYYGEGSAALLKSGSFFYIRMLKVPGDQLGSIEDKIFPPSAQEHFQHMICDLGDKGIIHSDLHLGNILYDRETNTFYPIDLSDEYERYHDEDDKHKKLLNDSSEDWYNKALKHIIEHTY